MYKIIENYFFLLAHKKWMYINFLIIIEFKNETFLLNTDQNSVD